VVVPALLSGKRQYAFCRILKSTVCLFVRGHIPGGNKSYWREIFNALW